MAFRKMALGFCLVYLLVSILLIVSYKVKYHANGSQERYKAHLMAKGYTQQEDIDYLDTFSLVAKLVTVEVFLTLVAIHG